MNQRNIQASLATYFVTISLLILVLLLLLFGSQLQSGFTSSLLAEGEPVISFTDLLLPLDSWEPAAERGLF